MRSTRLSSTNWGWTAISVGLGFLLVLGCSDPAQRLNSPPQGHTDADSQHEMQEHYISMNDNALLSEMSMSPVHFVSQSDELNSLGVRRLRRYAELLSIYGGTLHYDGSESEEMVEGRISRIESFLLAMGLNDTQFSVDHGMAGGEGMRASEAMLVRESTSFHPSDKSGGDTESELRKLFMGTN